MRPTWDETWMTVARTMARMSRCDRAKCGAVIVSNINRVLATGYNGPPANLPYDREATCSTFCPRALKGPTDATALTYEDCPSVHAEANALLFVDKTVLTDATCYVTGAVCIGCAKLLANSGIGRVVMATEDEDRDYRQPDLAIRHMRACGIIVEVMEHD